MQPLHGDHGLPEPVEDVAVDDLGVENESGERARIGRNRRARCTSEARPDLALESIVRREVFARTGPLASRYAVAPEVIVRRVVANCATGGGLRAARMVANVEDVLHAIACGEGHPFAWLDLLELHEGPLIRACAERIGDAPAIMLVRRWLAALRERCAGGRAFGHEPGPAANRSTGVTVTTAAGVGIEVPVTTFDAYTGTTPLRHWLAQQLIGPIVGNTTSDSFAPAPLEFRAPSTAAPMVVVSDSGDSVSRDSVSRDSVSRDSVSRDSVSRDSVSRDRATPTRPPLKRYGA